MTALAVAGLALGAPPASALAAPGGLKSNVRNASTAVLSWAPVGKATSYEVQWSKTRYPFNPEPDPGNSGAPGRMTLGTAAILPLAPGTWYYRVRGFNYSLPTNAQQMSWSDAARIVVAKPTFQVVGGGK